MKKICVIGNSHVGTLKKGYDSLEKKTYVAHFWAIPGGGGPRISIEENKILAREKDWNKIQTDIEPFPGTTLDILDYDAILLSGVGMPPIRNDREMIHNHYLAAGFIDGKVHGVRQVLSKTVFSQLISFTFHKRSSFQNIEKIESIFKKKIFIQLTPLPTSNVVNRPDFDLHDYGHNLGRFLFWYYNQQCLVIEESFRNKNISLVKYPADLVENGFTPVGYQNYNDAWHMNDKFGALFMGKLLHDLLFL